METVAFTFVKKSLQPAARASCLSLCRLDAVSATMMTGDLKRMVLGSLSSPSGSTCAAADGALLDAEDVKTPMLFSLSSLRISLVASKPFITGN